MRTKEDLKLKPLEKEALFEDGSPIGAPSSSSPTKSNASHYALTPNGTAVNGINKAISGRRIEDGEIVQTFSSSMYARNPYEGFVAYFDSSSKGKLTPATKQFLGCLYSKLTENDMRSPDIVIPLSEFQAMKGNISRTQAYLQAQTAMANLKGLTITFIEKTRKDCREKDFKFISVFDALEYEKGKITVSFGKRFFNHIRFYPLRVLPREVLSINGKLFQYAVTLSDVIEEHRRSSWKKGSVRDVLYVETLLKEAGLPSIDKVGRRYKEKIVIPFEKNLDALSYLSWSYIDNKDKPLKKKGADMSWDEFIYARVKTTLLHDPECKAYSKREDFVLDGNASDPDC